MGSKTDAVRTTRRRRRSHDDGVRPDPAPLSDALPRLATALDEAAEAAGWGARPSLVRVTAWPSQPVHPGFDLGIRPLEGDDSVVEALSGFTAPPEWMAIGGLCFSAACQTGALQSDGLYLYFCAAPNTWKRAALSSF